MRFVGVVFPPESAPLVEKTVAELSNKLSALTGAREFHFTDIFQGQSEFRGVPIDVRLDLLEAFANAVAALRPTIFIQSIDDETLQAVASITNLPSMPPPLNPREPRSFAFLGLLIRICQHIRDERKGQENAVIMCDHGLLKSGMGMHLPICPDVIYNDTVYFIDSQIEPGIQVADFAAFALNRHQIILQRGTLTDLEKSFLYATEVIAPFVRDVDQHRFTGPINPKYHSRYIEKKSE